MVKGNSSFPDDIEIKKEFKRLKRTIYPITWELILTISLIMLSIVTLIAIMINL